MHGLEAWQRRGLIDVRISYPSKRLRRGLDHAVYVRHRWGVCKAAHEKYSSALVPKNWSTWYFSLHHSLNFLLPRTNLLLTNNHYTRQTLIQRWNGFLLLANAFSHFYHDPNQLSTITWHFCNFHCHQIQPRTEQMVRNSYNRLTEGCWTWNNALFAYPSTSLLLLFIREAAVVFMGDALRFLPPPLPHL